MEGMTVEELRDELNRMIADGHGDLEVKFVYEYGDHNHSSVAQGVESVDTAYVVYSSYHGMDRVDEDGDDEDGESRLVVSLN